MLASVSVVSLETSAQTCYIAASTTARAIASLGASISTENVISRGTFLLRTVSTTISIITLASHGLISIPRSVVRCSLQRSKSLLSQANTTPRAVIRAHGPFTSLAIVIFETRAFTSLTIAKTLVGTLHFRMNIVLGNDQFGCPCSALWACS